MKATILGTSSAMPTFRRSLSGTMLERENESFLFDCGEGTQFQIMRAGLRRGALRSIFITHLHGDHFFGLPGLLATLGLNRRDKPMDVWGPRGLKKFIEQVLSCPRPYELSFPVRIHEIAPNFKGILVDTDAYQISTEPLHHRVPTQGYRLEEKPRPGVFDAARADELGIPFGRERGALHHGRSVTLEDGTIIEPEQVVGPSQPGKVFAYCTDTVPCDEAVNLAWNADLLVHEATYADAERDLAIERRHCTIRQAATVALDAEAKKLVATHFSTRYRYRDLEKMALEGREVFENLVMAEDLMTIEF